MNKLYISGLVISVLALPVITHAVGQGAQQGMENENISETKKMIITPTGVSNQNRVETQNQGEENQIQTQEMEKEELEGTGEGQYGQNRSQNAYEHMSIVAQKVAEFQMLGDREGGLGEQVREIAQNQNQSQEKIQTELGRLDGRQGWLKLLIGPDLGAIKNIKMEMEQNRVRIQQLEQLQTRTNSQGDDSAIQEMVQALIAENEALQNMLTQEEGTKSMLGWLFRFLAK